MVVPVLSDKLHGWGVRGMCGTNTVWMVTMDRVQPHLASEASKGERNRKNYDVFESSWYLELVMTSLQ